MTHRMPHTRRARPFAVIAQCAVYHYYLYYSISHSLSPTLYGYGQYSNGLYRYGICAYGLPQLYNWLQKHTCTHGRTDARTHACMDAQVFPTHPRTHAHIHERTRKRPLLLPSHINGGGRVWLGRLLTAVLSSTPCTCSSGRSCAPCTRG